MWDILAGQAWKNAESKGLLRGKTLSDHVDGIISEIDEALEAYETGRFAIEPTFRCKFEESYKDTFEDELADIVLRTLTMCKEYCFEDYIWYPKESLKEHIPDLEYIKGLLESADILDIRFKIGSVIGIVVIMAEHNGIPLAFHIQEKMKYNKNRPFLHGKVDIN